MSVYLQDDVLFDHPDKKHLARLLIWWAWGDKLKLHELKWLTPYFKRYAKYHEWKLDDVSFFFAKERADGKKAIAIEDLFCSVGEEYEEARVTF
jgi:hypothetical protein